MFLTLIICIRVEFVFVIKYIDYKYNFINIGHTHHCSFSITSDSIWYRILYVIQYRILQFLIYLLQK